MRRSGLHPIGKPGREKGRRSGNTKRRMDRSDLAAGDLRDVFRFQGRVRRIRGRNAIEADPQNMIGGAVIVRQGRQHPLRPSCIQGGQALRTGAVVDQRRAEDSVPAFPHDRVVLVADHFAHCQTFNAATPGVIDLLTRQPDDIVVAIRIEPVDPEIRQQAAYRHRIECVAQRHDQIAAGHPPSLQEHENSRIRTRQPRFHGGA